MIQISERSIDPNTSLHESKFPSFSTLNRRVQMGGKMLLNH